MIVAVALIFAGLGFFLGAAYMVWVKGVEEEQRRQRFLRSLDRNPEMMIR